MIDMIERVGLPTPVRQHPLTLLSASSSTSTSPGRTSASPSNPGTRGGTAATSASAPIRPGIAAARSSVGSSTATTRTPSSTRRRRPRRSWPCTASRTADLGRSPAILSRPAQQNRAVNAIGRPQCLEHGDGAEATFEVVLEGAGGEDADLVGGAGLGHRQHGVEGAAEDAAQQRQGLGADGLARAAGPAQHAALVEVEGDERHVGLGAAAADARVELGAQALGGQQLPEERRHDERARALGDRAQHADEHAVQLRGRLALQRQLVGGLQHGQRLRRPVEASTATGPAARRDSAWLTMSSSRPRYSSSRTWLIGSSRAPNLRRRLADALGHGAHLAVLGRQQHDDPVGLAELVRAQHDADVAVEVRAHADESRTGPSDCQWDPHRSVRIPLTTRGGRHGAVP